MKKTHTEVFLEGVDTFLAKHGMSENRFSTSIGRDSQFLTLVRSGGRSPTLRNVERIEAEMEAHTAEAAKAAKAAVRKFSGPGHA